MLTLIVDYEKFCFLEKRDLKSITHSANTLTIAFNSKEIKPIKLSLIEEPRKMDIFDVSEKYLEVKIVMKAIYDMVENDDMITVESLTNNLTRLLIDNRKGE